MLVLRWSLGHALSSSARPLPRRQSCQTGSKPAKSMRNNPEEKRQPDQSSSTGPIVGGVLGALVVIGIIVGIIFAVRKRRRDEEGPPKHKPPPPVKKASSTEMLSKPPEPTATESVPLSPGEVYYEPTGGEPGTNMDEGTLNGGAPPVLDNSAREFASGHHGNDSSNHGPPAVNIPRGESFVSPAMYV